MAHGRDAARDTRHGRRGGRWAPDAPKPVKPRADVEPFVCPTCGRPSARRNTVPIASHCGTPYCTAMNEWGDEQWAGRARMAKARQAARKILDPLDREALRRHP